MLPIAKYAKTSQNINKNKISLTCRFIYNRQSSFSFTYHNKPLNVFGYGCNCTFDATVTYEKPEMGKALNQAVEMKDLDHHLFPLQFCMNAIMIVEVPSFGH